MPNVIHIYNANCFTASRVLWQSSLDDTRFFIHANDSPRLGSKSDISTQLKPINIRSFKLACHSFISSVKSANPQVVVFHAQSSLFFLILLKAYCIFSPSFKVSILYDVHDLLPSLAPFMPSYFYIRYILFRTIYFTALEFISLRFFDTKCITVSSGLSHILASKYLLRRKPVVVHSVGAVSTDTIHELTCSSSVYNTENLVYFGAPDRIPFQLFPQFFAESIGLHLYGPIHPFQESIDRQFRSVITQFGPYTPYSLSFLKSYTFSIIYLEPERFDANYKFSLPNKLFQSIAYGLTVFASPQFYECHNLFSDLPGAVLPIEASTCLSSLMHKALALRGNDYHFRLQEKMKVLVSTAKFNYLSALLFP